MNNTAGFSQPIHGKLSNKKPATKEGSEMPTNAPQDLGASVRLHAKEPILERRCDMYGQIKVYPPAVDPSEWTTHSWLITSETDPKGNPPGIREELKAEAVWECWNRVYFISDTHRFQESS